MPDEHISFSPKRRRTYKRKFSYEEAEELHKAGMNYASLASKYGVSRSAIRKAMKRLRDSRHLPRFVEKVHRCPECSGPRDKDALRCRKCHQASRMPKQVMVAVPAREDVMVGGVQFGRVVLYAGRYAVVEPHFNDGAHRQMHFWDGPPEVVSVLETCDVLESTEVEDRGSR